MQKKYISSGTVNLVININRPDELLKLLQDLARDGFENQGNYEFLALKNLLIEPKEIHN